LLITVAEFVDDFEPISAVMNEDAGMLAAL